MPRKIKSSKPSLRERFKEEQKEEHIARKQEIDEDLQSILAQEATPDQPERDDHFLRPVLTPSWQLLPKSATAWKQNIEAGIILCLLPSLLAFLGGTLLQDTLTLYARGSLVVTNKTWLGAALYLTAGLWAFLASPALAYLTTQAAKGNQPSVRQCIRYGLPRLWRFMLVYAAMAGLIIGGLLLLIVPGLWMIRRTLLAPYYVIDRNISVREALRLSAEETQPWANSIWGLMGVLFALSFIGLTVNSLAHGLGGVLTGIGGIIGSAITLLYVFAPAFRYREISDREAGPEVVYGSRS